MCETLDQVKRMFGSWQQSFERRTTEHLEAGCVRTTPDCCAAAIEYLGAFEDAHWYADLLKFNLLKHAAPGVLVFERTYFGYGSAMVKPGVLNRLPAAKTQ